MAVNTLITGGAGFIGSHLAQLLKEQGCHVILVDDMSTGRRENISHLLDSRCELVEAPASEALKKDPSLLDGVQHVYHLAASVGVRLVAADPAAIIRNNVAETQVLLTAAASCDAILVASSSEVYGRTARLPMSEDDDLVFGATSSSRWCYGISKALAEHLSFAYHARPGASVVVVRLFNTIGPRQIGHYGMVVPRFVERAVAGQALPIYGSGQQTRAFCDVRDVVRAMTELMNSPVHHGQVYNVGSDHALTIDELADQVIALAGSSSTKRYIPFEQAYQPGFEDIAQRVADLSKIQRAIGFEPRYTLDQTGGELISLANDLQTSVAGGRG